MRTLKYVHGDINLINACISKWDKNKANPNTSGANGTVQKITLDNGAKYFVKKISKPNIPVYEEHIKREIDIGVELTKKIPDHVSKVIAAAYFIKTRFFKASSVEGYIIFEYLNGYDMFKYALDEEKVTRSNFDDVFEKINKAVSALHSIGLVHQDIKFENLFAVLNDDGSLNRVLLIDYDTIAKEGSAWRPIGTTDYVEDNVKDYFRLINNVNSNPYDNRAKVRLAEKKLNFEKRRVSKGQNNYSIKVMKDKVRDDLGMAKQGGTKRKLTKSKRRTMRR